MPPSLPIGRLQGGGLVLGWRCTSRCRHCLYGSGPHRTDGKPSPAVLDELLDLLVERAPLARFHIGGGEPLTDRALLRQAIAGMRDRGLTLEYVETNAAWVRDRDQAEGVLSDLARAGLGCVLVSVSPFHAEHVPFDKTKTLIQAAERVLPGGTLVWLPNFLPVLASLPAGETLDFDQHIERGKDRWALEQGLAYGLIEGGRAGRYLARHGRRMGWQEAAHRAPCAARLTDTSHFHVDGEGLYVPGLCAGIGLPVELLPGEVHLSPYPVLAALWTGGLEALVDLARRSGFDPLPAYSGPCDLCTHLRLHLFQHDPSPELSPVGFYAPDSLDTYG